MNNKIDDEFRIDRGGNLFYYKGNDDKEEIIVPENVSYIEEGTFRNLKNVKRIILPSSLKSIEAKAFINLPHLKEVTIKENVYKIEPLSFYRCPLLDSFIIIKNDSFFEKEGLLYNYMFSNKVPTLLYCPKNKEGEVVIEKCDIENNVFVGCNKIKSLTIDTKGWIKTNTFKGLINLTSLTIHPFFMYIEEETFKDLKNLEELKIDEGNSDYKVIDNVLYYRDTLFYVPPKYSGTITLPSFLRNINYGAFNSKSFTSLVVPEPLNLATLVRKEDCLFDKCENLKTIVFENPKTIVKPYWFSSFIDFNVDSEDRRRFIYFLPCIRPSQIASDLKKIVGEFVVEILEKNKNEITTENVTPQWMDEWRSYFIHQKKKYYNEIIQNKTYQAFFLDNQYLKLLDIKNIIKICNDKEILDEEAVFLEYENTHFSFDEILKEKEKEITASFDSTLSVSQTWNYRVTKDKHIRLTNYKGSDTNVIVPSLIGDKEVWEIGERAFSPESKLVDDSQIKVRQNITSITLSDTVRKVSINSFNNMPKLNHITLSKNLILERDIKYSLTSTNKGLISSCNNLSTLEIPEGIKKIGRMFFYSSRYLKKLILPSSLEIIEAEAFTMSERLEEIEFSQGLKEIGEESFMYCTQLKKLILPEGLERIDHSAFSRCYSLKEIYIPQSVKKIEDDSFGWSVLPDFQLKGIKNSYAHKWARKKKFPFTCVTKEEIEEEINNQ